MTGDGSSPAPAVVVTLGEAMGLVLVDGVGRIDVARHAQLSFGGAELNVAVGLARLGTPSAWFGRLGRDAFGTRIHRAVRAEPLLDAHVVTGEAPTGLMVRHRPTARSAVVDYHRAASAGAGLTPDDLDPRVFDGAAVVHLTGITPALSRGARDAVLAAADIARDVGSLLSFDVNYRSALWTEADARRALRSLAQRADLLFASPNEARLLLDTKEVDRRALAEALAEVSPEVILKDGEHGCVLHTGGATTERPASPTAVVDPVGAGDAFVAGYLSERAAGRPGADCLDTALAMGAYAVSVPGDIELLPTREELASFSDRPDVAR